MAEYRDDRTLKSQLEEENISWKPAKGWNLQKGELSEYSLGKMMSPWNRRYDYCMQKSSSRESVLLRKETDSRAFLRIGSSDRRLYWQTDSFILEGERECSSWGSSCTGHPKKGNKKKTKKAKVLLTGYRKKIGFRERGEEK